MVNFEAAKQVAFNTLSKGNLVSKVSDDDKKSLKFLPHDLAHQYEVFTIETEYLNVANIAEDLSVYMVLKPDFPLTLPKVYLPQDTYDRIKYIPHVDMNCFVCTFDVETTRANPNDPGGIAQACLSRAIAIIENGISNANIADFEEEFKAYWENEYDGEADVKEDILALVDDPQHITELSFIKLGRSISVYNHVIYQDDETGRRFMNHLNYRKITYSKESICYLGLINIPFHPPLVLNNERVDQIVSALTQQQQTAFRKYINGPGHNKFMFGYTLVDGSPLYLGWIHGKFDLKRKGFRKETLTNYYVFKHFQKKDRLTRISPQLFTPQQAILRTNGLKEHGAEHKFLIAGLGSIGSNLLFFLNSLNSPEFRLIDYDELTIDNLNRHFLGINYLGMRKTAALKNHYTLKNPFQIITSKEESIIATCQADLVYVNDTDFIFCAIGKANVDQWIGHALQSGLITKPVFFLWVEPYLCGGHCLFLIPGGKNYDDYFDNNNFYKNNIIENTEYLNGNTRLSMREIGCQISYTPYSLNNVTAFLAAIFPEIRKIIDQPPTNSTSITWQGDLQILDDMGIKKSTFAEGHLGEALIIST
jgi:hypothetical protein